MSSNRSSLGVAVIGTAAAVAAATAIRHLSSSGAASRDDSVSPPSNTDVRSGRNKLQTSLRSVVMSRICYYLFHGFNPDCTVKRVSFCPTDNRAMPDFTAKKEDARDAILAESAKVSKREVPITKGMASRMDALSSLKQAAFTFAEGKIKTGEQQPPRLDVAHATTGGKNLVGFVEVGLMKDDESKASKKSERGADFYLDRLFWEKIDQAMNYLGLLSDTRAVATNEEEMKLVVNETLLFTVIVMDRARKFGRIAIFACEEKDYVAPPGQLHPSENWRVALMWRKEGPIPDLSAAFGFYVSAVECLANGEASKGSSNEQWKYFGPNCTKVTYMDQSQEVGGWFDEPSTRFNSSNYTVCLLVCASRNRLYFGRTTTVFGNLVEARSCTRIGTFSRKERKWWSNGRSASRPERVRM